MNPFGRFVKQHPYLYAVLAAVAFLLFQFPQWLASVWSLFSDDPLIPTIFPRFTTWWESLTVSGENVVNVIFAVLLVLPLWFWRGVKKEARNKSEPNEGIIRLDLDASWDEVCLVVHNSGTGVLRKVGVFAKEIFVWNPSKKAFVQFRDPFPPLLVGGRADIFGDGPRRLALVAEAGEEGKEALLRGEAAAGKERIITLGAAGKYAVNIFVSLGGEVVLRRSVIFEWKGFHLYPELIAAAIEPHCEATVAMQRVDVGTEVFDAHSPYIGQLAVAGWRQVSQAKNLCPFKMRAVIGPQHLSVVVQSNVSLSNVRLLLKGLEFAPGGDVAAWHALPSFQETSRDSIPDLPAHTEVTLNRVLYRAGIDKKSWSLSGRHVQLSPGLWRVLLAIQGHHHDLGSQKQEEEIQFAFDGEELQVPEHSD